MAHYLGIDLHKRTSTWVLIDEKQKVVHRRTYNRVDPEAIAEGVKHLPVTVAGLPAALEPVCGWRWVSKQLEAAGMTVTIGNPLRTRIIADSKQKNDRIDARVLAELLSINYLPQAYRASDEVAALRDIVREREYLVCMRTGLKNRIHAVVTAQGYHAILKNPLNKRGEEYLRDTGIGTLERSYTIMHSISQEIAALDRLIRQQLKANPIAELLMSMPGVGDITAVTVLAEVGDFSRFPSPKQLASFAGLVPSERSSAGKARYGRITKTGSRYLRSVMVGAASRIRASDTELYRFYEQVKENTTPLKARVALARKMLTIMWYLVAYHTPYATSASSTKRVDLVRSSGA